MRKASPILVVTKPGDLGGDSWRRFLAILCFMEFYTEFVTRGTSLWLLWNHESRPRELAEAYCIGALLLLRPICLYLCGRALWFGSKHARRWVLLAGVLVLLAMLCVAWSDYGRFRALRGGTLTWPPRPWGNLGFVLRRAAEMLPLLACLFVSLRFLRSPAETTDFHTARWVVLAAVWCFAVAIKEAFAGGAGEYLAWWSQTIHLETVAPFVYATVVAGTGVLLVLKAAPARTVALILAVMGAIITCQSTYVLPMLVNASIQAILISALNQPYGLPYHWVHTRAEFQAAFVQSVTLIGPWLLIALYARFVLMRTPPEDGSPYPRRYCRKCFYNLYGLAADRCPECGASLRGGVARFVGSP